MRDNRGNQLSYEVAMRAIEVFSSCPKKYRILFGQWFDMKPELIWQDFARIFLLGSREPGAKIDIKT